MFFRYKVKYVVVLVTIIFLYIVIYLNRELNKPQTERPIDLSIEDKIYLELSRLPQKYKERKLQHDNITDTFLANINQVTLEKNLTVLWDEANSWPKVLKFVNTSSSNLGNILNALKTSPIIYADLDGRGTQLKFLLTLEGHQQAVFKPKWYNIDKIIEDSVYAGKDRYGSEILGFYLSIILNKPLAPLAVERILSLKNDILPVASSRLRTTSFTHNNVTCVYGTCFYCKKEDPICDDSSASLNGALIFNVNAKMKSSRSPWQRTYKKDKKAAWEESSNYCNVVKNKLHKRRIYDLIDVAIFDFLIQNGDRHHYETLEDTLVYIDNGKGLGNPHRTYLDILAPLYQCCMLRRGTWRRLQLLSGGFLGEKLRQMPDIRNFVADGHLHAIDDRLLLIFATVEYCQKKNSNFNNIM